MSSADTPSRRWRRVGRPARDGQPERDRAGVGDHDVEVRRLGDDREVAGGAGPDRGERALPAVLLGRDERDEQLAGEPSPAPAATSARTAPRIAATPPFMSQAPRPYSRPSRMSAAPRIGRPGRRIAGWDHVEVARQDRPAARPAGPAAR